jgi:hypothetical protein
MSTDQPWRPHIYRTWDPREGIFIWTVTAPRANAWTGKTLHKSRELERKARMHAMHLNAMDRQRRTSEVS